MDKPRDIHPSCEQLHKLTQELLRATLESDWPRLGRVDAELGRQSLRWAPVTQWGAEERAALQGLRQAHAKASQKCVDALAQLDAALVQMREGRSRWQAYAESSDWQTEEHGA